MATLAALMQMAWRHRLGGGRRREAACLMRGVERQVRQSGAPSVAVLIVLLTPGIARAQQADSGRVEVGGGLHYVGSLTFDEVNASETSFGGVRRELFRSRSELERSPGIVARVGVRLTSILQAESSIAFDRTRLATRITGDEEAPDTTVTEPLTRYLLEAGLVADLARWRAGRVSPFATAGIGYLRQLHDGHTLVDTGASYYVGGGLDYLLNLTGAPGTKAVGMRLDVRGMFVTDPLTLDGATHVVPVAGVSMFFRF